MVATPCQAPQLAATAYLQGATGALLGGIVFSNRGALPCSLSGRPRVRLVDGRGRDLGVHLVSLRSPVRTVTLPRRGRAGGAYLRLAWRNFCGRPAAVLARVLLPGGGGVVRVRLRDRPRCDAKSTRSTLGVAPFVRWFRA